MTLFIQTWPPECRLTLPGNKFSQGKELQHIHQKADPEKKNVLRDVGCLKPPVFLLHLHIIQLIHLVTDGHALLSGFRGSENSAFCYAIVILKRNKGENEQHYNWQSAFNITPRELMLLTQ